MTNNKNVLLLNFSSCLNRFSFFHFCQIKKNLIIFNFNTLFKLLLDIIIIYIYPHKEKSFKFAISTDTQ